MVINNNFEEMSIVFSDKGTPHIDISDDVENAHYLKIKH
jgi:hypothetical protein